MGVYTSSQGAVGRALNTASPQTITKNSVYNHLLETGGGYVTNTVTADGSGAQSDNIFLVQGAVIVNMIYAECMEATDATTLTLAYWDMWDGTAALEITDNGGANLSGIVAGGLISKAAVATSPLAFANNAAGVFVDGGGSGYYKLFCPFRVIAKSGAATYIRFNFTGDANTDVDLKHKLRYIPRSDDGNITAV